MTIPSPKKMNCENLSNPLGVDVKNPRFSWVPEHFDRGQYQTAYRIIISRNLENLMNENGDEWDSGKINSKCSTFVSYSGNHLESNKKYYWRVMWWDKEGNYSNFSEIAFFTTGILNNNELIAKWIRKKEFTEFRSKGTMLSGQFMGDYVQVHALYLRKEFNIRKDIKFATVFVSGIGFYELRLNGEKIGDHVLDPAQTDYNKIALYSTFDITDKLKENNVLGSIIGNGRHIRYYGFDYPKFLLQLVIEYSDGSSENILTDESWKVSHGPLTENSIYNGEKYDARYEMVGWDYPGFSEVGWENASCIDGPSIKSQMMQPIRITNHIKPKQMFSPSAGLFVFDFQQNFSGWVRIKVQGERGSEIKIRYSENIYEDGSLNTLANEKAESTDTYTLKGEGIESYEPICTYHGFRYVELKGFPGVPTLENVLGCFVHSDVESVGEFYCSNELINKIHKNILWGQLSNLMSIPTDCSQRDERHGWMGDAHLSSEEAIFNFDMKAFYENYLNDIKLSQKEDGSIPDVVPPYYRHLYPADPAWGAAYIIITWFVYHYYGDLIVLKDHYDCLKKYIGSLINRSNGYLVKTMGKYGDWCPPGSVPPKMTPLEFTASWFFYHDTLTLSKIANVLGNISESENYYNISEKIKDAFNNAYLEEDKYLSLSNVPTEKHPSQTSQALPLFLDMVPDAKKEKVLERFLYSVINRNDYHVDTGIIGTRYLLDTLSKYGYDEVAYKIVNQKSYPGWGYMVQEGATTLWERWEKLTGGSMNSHNHIMSGSVDAWFYRVLAGVSCIEPGWKKILFKPPVIKDIKFASASLKTVAGNISVSWQKSEDFFNIVTIVPVGSIAEVYIPYYWQKYILSDGENVIMQDNVFLKDNEFIKFVRKDEKYIHLEIQNGFYNFCLKKLLN